MKVENVKITKVSLSMADHGCLDTAILALVSLLLRTVMD